MQIVIDIPEEEFNYYQIAKVENPTLLESVIKNGIPLDKVIDDSKGCKSNDDIIFSAIYSIINKHIGKDNE